MTVVEKGIVLTNIPSTLFSIYEKIDKIDFHDFLKKINQNLKTKTVLCVLVIWSQLTCNRSPLLLVVLDIGKVIGSLSVKRKRGDD